MKKVIITGGCRGIGEKITELFYKNGYLTVALYSSSDKNAEEMKKKMPGLIAEKCDVSNPSEIKAVFRKMDGADVLINNAGVSKTALITDHGDEDIKRIMDVNLMGTIYACREIVPYMLKKGGGSIVNISSIWGISGASMETVYSASKAGIIGFTKALSKELGPSLIRVNAVAPGFVDTDMNKDLTYEERADFLDSTPLMRAGTREEIAKAVYFLASDDSAFTTGQVLSPNGGIC